MSTNNTMNNKMADFIYENDGDFSEVSSETMLCLWNDAGYDKHEIISLSQPDENFHNGVRNIDVPRMYVQVIRNPYWKSYINV